MNAQHSKAVCWVRSGVFDGLKSFTDFEAKVNKVPEEKDRGDIFEIFIEGYLATQPITQCVKYWVVGDIPLTLREKYNLPRDATGIDGIYETHVGNHIAYQVKYRQKSNLTFAEVAPFLGITEAFTDRVIFTNASTLSNKAIVRTRWFSSEIFNAQIVYPFFVKLIETEHVIIVSEAGTQQFAFIDNPFSAGNAAERDIDDRRTDNAIATGWDIKGPELPILVGKGRGHSCEYVARNVGDTDRTAESASQIEAGQHRRIDVPGSVDVDGDYLPGQGIVDIGDDVGVVI